jgi:predicted TIM-barrel fold metal-dependent hydrolase
MQMAKTAIISVDGHVKASRAGFRDYVDPQYRDEYDAAVKAAEESGMPDSGNMNPEYGVESQWDSDARLGALDPEGVVAEVLFPNGMPFQVNPFDDFGQARTAELSAAGRRAYNRWLLDFCNEAPGRRAGQAVVSFLDVDQAVQDVHWAKEQGLAGIMIPAVQPNVLYMFDPKLDPIWAAVEETGLTLSQHGGAGIEAYSPSGFAHILTLAIENAFFANRSLWQMIAGGVFDRFRNLRAAFIETQTMFMVPAIAQLERTIDNFDDWMQWASFLGLEKTLERRPSEYFGQQIFVGVSPFTPLQIAMDDLLGTSDTGSDAAFHIGAEAAMFGVDYPHFESIAPHTKAEVSCLLNTPGVTEIDVQKILFDTAADLYGFDAATLAPHTERVGFELDDLRTVDLVTA